MFLLVLALAGFSATVLGDCDGCWCVAADDSQCPSWKPKNYTAAEIDSFAAQVALNPITLACDPFQDYNCELSPHEPRYDGAPVCGLIYTDETCSTYELRTFHSATEAWMLGAQVTHTGQCGACSTTQDLAAYMRVEDIISAGKQCALRALVSRSRAEGCFQQLGLTTSCAKLWAAEVSYDTKHCTWACVRHAHEPYNGPSPSCSLNECLQCDEDLSGRIFELFAARSHRNSGLISTVTRPCTSVAQIEHHTCPEQSRSTIVL
mmetsp:Transcript_55842/g.130678  ORF Transcript_55842/g.130678 Transcript_55842/m.130678 type:complete len:263 (-) Transcript_55842:36-824(-)